MDRFIILETDSMIIKEYLLMIKLHHGKSGILWLTSVTTLQNSNLLFVYTASGNVIGQSIGLLPGNVIGQ